MKAAAYLSQVRDIDNLIRKKEKELKSIRDAIPSASNPAKEYIAGGTIPGDTATINLIQRLEEQDREIDRLKSQLQQLTEKIERDLSAMPVPLHADILRKCYLEMKPTWIIADELHYTDRNIFYLKRKALKEYHARFGQTFHSLS